MTVTYALRVNYSVAIVAMTDEKEAREGFEVRNQLNTYMYSLILNNYQHFRNSIGMSRPNHSS